MNDSEDKTERQKERERMLAVAIENGARQAALDAAKAEQRLADSRVLKDYLLEVQAFTKPPDMVSKDGKDLSERLTKGLDFMAILIEKFIEYTPGATDMN